MLTPAVTILLSSFLLFLVQPILAKQILPWFGGSAGVWTICLVFFQVALLLGYTYAHWLTRRPVRSRRLVLHVLLLLVSCLALPIIPGSFWKPGHDSLPTLRILGVLIATVGLPYVVLASTGPLLQHWLSGAANSPSQDRSVYRLFALSNLGSIIGLLAYPFAIEPFATVYVQAWVWSCAYVLFAICLISYAWKTARMPNVQRARAATGAGPGCPPSRRFYASWIGCAALGSALLLAVSNQITQNVASIPFLWIIPLAIYLLSFVICFEGGWYERRFWMTPAMLATGAMAWALFADQANLSIYLALPIYIVGLLFGCIVCHGELARSKPHSTYLTHFYLSLATGGALGGLLVGVVAPIVFDNYWEMPLSVIGLAVLGVYICAQEIRVQPKTSWAANFLAASVATSLILLLLGALPSALDPYTLSWAKIVKGDARWGCAALLIVSALMLQRHRMSRAIALTALLCTATFEWGYYHSFSTGVELGIRNFYGALRVIDSPYGTTHMRRLKHGVILHGAQVMGPPQRELPTTYYGETSGIGRTILSQEAAGPLRLGSIGLGAGTLAVYGRPGDVFRAYELNPAVLKIAENQFTYLSESKARVEPVLGDGRLSLEVEIADGEFDKPAQRFDILSLDAFSGDGIPVHLLTREAFATYARVIKPDGVIAFHLSNRYLDLPPVVEQIARDAGFQTVLVADRPFGPGLTYLSDWVLVTRSTAFLQQQSIAQYSRPIVHRPELAIWTDQFSNLFQILK
jgi:hypothetical protein